MGNGEMELTNEESRNLKEYGLAQLAETYAMQRQQDANLWSVTGMFAATNGVLIIALFSVLGRDAGDRWLEVFLGVFGLILCLSWFLIAVRASSRAFGYKCLAKQLQCDLHILPKHRIWMTEPRGIKTTYVYLGLPLMFGVLWVGSAFYGASHPDCVFLLDLVTAIVVIVGFVATFALIEWKALR